jgi:hypothetical protein
MAMAVAVDSAMDKETTIYSEDDTEPEDQVAGAPAPAMDMDLFKEPEELQEVVSKTTCVRCLRLACAV